MNFLRGKILFILAGVLSLCLFRPWLSSDGIYYYGLLVSLVQDHDLSLYNQPLPWYWFGNMHGYLFRPEAGYVVLPVSMGTSLLWSPAYVVASGLAKALAGLGIHQALPSYNALAVSAVCFSSLALSLAGCLICRSLCLRVADDSSSTLAVFLLFIGTPLLAYSTVEPSFSHSSSFFCLSLFLWRWLRYREDSSLWNAALVGLAGGLAGLVRLQDAFFLILPGVDIGVFLWRHRTREHLVRRTGHGLAMMGVVLFVMTPQCLAWWITEGHVLHQTPGFWGMPGQYLLEVLLSPRKGLFVWSPVLWLSLPGWILLCRKDRPLGALILLGFLVQSVLNGSIHQWWGGGGFGGRRFVNLLPFFALGLAATLKACPQGWNRILKVLATLAAGFNVLLMSLFYGGIIEPEAPLAMEALFHPIRIAGSLLDLVSGPLAYGRLMNWSVYPRVSESVLLGLLSCLGTAIVLGLLVRVCRQRILWIALVSVVSLDAAMIVWDRKMENLQEVSLFGVWDLSQCATGGTPRCLSPRSPDGILALDVLPLRLRKGAWKAGGPVRLSELGYLRGRGEMQISLTSKVRAPKSLRLVIDTGDKTDAGTWWLAEEQTIPGVPVWNGVSACVLPGSSELSLRHLTAFEFNLSGSQDVSSFTLCWEIPTQASVAGIYLSPEGHQPGE